MQVKICGIPHKVIFTDNHFDIDLHLGQINYDKAEIYINNNMTEELKEEALCHEILHGILMHLGYNEQNQDEQFVQAVANAISQTFIAKATFESEDKE